MRLALALGKTLGELRREVSAPEMALWLALWHLEPWGDERAEASRAIVGSAVCGSMGAKVSPADLMPKWGQTKQKMTKEDWEAFVASHNAKQKESSVNV